MKKRAYEFKLCRVSDVGQSFQVHFSETAFDYWQEAIRSRDWFHEATRLRVSIVLRSEAVRAR